MNDIPEFFNSRTRTARRIHQCCECHGVILVGENYRCHFGKWSGEVFSFKECSDCFSLKSELNQDRYLDEYTAFGELFEDCSNTDDEWLRKMVVIMTKRGAAIPNWAIDRLKNEH